jgi:hypothetical protein
MARSGDRRWLLPDAVAVLALAALPLWLARDHWQAAWPWSDDAVSMVLPTAIARRVLASGDLPVSSALYFQGESLLTPHSQLLYPPWWVTFLPIPLGDALKLVIGAHFVAAPLVVYWYARRADLPVHVAAGLGAAAAMPLAGLSWHHQKTLGWPWLLLLAGQLLPWEWADARRSGVVIGLSGGAMLLASSLYYAWYGALLVAPLFLLQYERERLRWALLSVLVGVPALVFNILPYLGSSRPPAGWWLTPPTLITGLTGIGPTERRLVRGFQVWGVPFEGYAVVGLGIVCLGIAGGYLGVRDGRPKWVAAVGASGCLGLTLAMHPLPYFLPLVGTFRTAGRANVMVALALLVLSVYACRAMLDREFSLPGSVSHERIPDRRLVMTAITLLLVLSVASGVSAWQSFDRGEGTALDESHAFAASLPTECGDDVWAEMYHGGAAIPRGHLGMALLDAGYTLDAVYFAAIGASYSTRHADGTLAFDLLLSPAPIDGTEPLTGGSAQTVRGTVSSAELRLLGTREYRGQRLWVYAVEGRCPTATP